MEDTSLNDDIRARDMGFIWQEEQFHVECPVYK
jgi:hypothetical protein